MDSKQKETGGVVLQPESNYSFV